MTCFREDGKHCDKTIKFRTYFNGIHNSAAGNNKGCATLHVTRNRSPTDDRGNNFLNMVLQGLTKGMREGSEGAVVGSKEVVVEREKVAEGEGVRVGEMLLHVGGCEGERG
ncbi:hypothetical protein TSUD_96680 [Trifolium subterraneum]|nr:hypothetical protein TSUD_96680 [Trifolium subterraneum]